MTGGHDERDEFEDWVRGSVEPLPPPPGTYERVRRQARRRRLAKAVTVGLAAVVVVAGGVTVPRMINAGQPEPVRPEVTTSTPVHTPRPSERATHPTQEPTQRPHPSKGTTGSGEISSTPDHSAPPPAAGPGRCHTSDLSVHLTGSGAGAGQRYAGLVLTNTSSGPCTLYGYVGIGLIGPNGPMPTNLIRDPGPRAHITVSPGESAATSLHWSAIPGDNGNSGCAQPTTIEVTPPDETTQRTTEWSGSAVCQHGELHTVPLIPGSSPPPI